MPPAADVWSLLPELWVTVLGLILLVLTMFLSERRGNVVGWVAIVGLLLGLIPSWGLIGVLQGSGRVSFFNSYAVDGFAVFFKVVALVSTALVIMVALDYFRAPTEPGTEPSTPFEAEAYVLLVFTALGLMLMAAAVDLVLLALSIEFVSLTSYVLAGFLKTHPKSNEAGLKYFLYGATASATMFYGFSILYGLAGSTNLYVIAQRLQGVPVGPLVLSLALMMAGLGFKISMVPFHQWTPDVYEGSPTPIAAFFSVGSKAAGFAALVRILAIAFEATEVDWVPLVAGLATLSLFLGNLLALPQRNIKRMLAYSSISHAGFILIGVAAFGGDFGEIGLLVYIAAYLFMNLGAFFVASLIGSRLGSDEILDYSGLSQRAPTLAFLMALFMLSLTGIPPLAGFFAKLYVFGAAIEQGLLWLVVVGVVNSVISLYYYVSVIRAMYLLPPLGPVRLEEPATMRLALGIVALGTVLVGVWPQPLIMLARSAALLLRL